MPNTQTSSPIDGRRRKLLTAAIAFAAFGILTGLHWFGPTGGLFPSSRSGSEDSIALPERNAMAIAQLESALAAEVQQRREVSNRLAELNAELSRLRLMSDRDGSSSGATPPDGVDLGPDAEADGDAGAEVDAAAFDREALLAEGVDPREVDRLHDVWVQQELDRARIAYEALREGWFFTARHRTELSGLDQALREELTDEDYDRYLFARGEANRLKAVEVLEGSSASQAGLRRGDVIVRYDDVRVFKSGDILVTAAKGPPGESVPVEILRDGRREVVYVSRGPLGVIVKPSHGAPLSD